MEKCILDIEAFGEYNLLIPETKTVIILGLQLYKMSSEFCHISFKPDNFYVGYFLVLNIHFMISEFGIKTIVFIEVIFARIIIIFRIILYENICIVRYYGKLQVETKMTFYKQNN